MENDPVSFVEWMTILMKAQEGLRFHWEFYTTAYLIMVGWLMSMAKKGLTVRDKLIVTVVFLLIAGGFVTNLRDYFEFLNAGYRHLTDKLPAYFQVAGDDSRNMVPEFHLMFSYYRYEILGYGAFGLSTSLLIYLIWSLPPNKSEKRLRRNYRPHRVREGTKHVSQKLRNRLR